MTEDPQPWRPREEVDERRSGRTEVLGIVQEQQQLTRLQRTGESLERLSGDVDAERAGDCRHEQVGIPERRQPDECAAVGERRGGPANRLDRQPRLSRAERAGPDEQPDVLTLEQCGQLGKLVVAAEKRIRRGRQARGCLGDCRRVEHPVLLQDLPLQLAELRPRLEAELVAQMGSGPGECVEGLDLAACTVERKHQLPLEALAEWVSVGEPAELREQPLVVAKCELGFEPLFQRDESQIVETRGFGAGELLLGKLLVSRPVPESEPTLQQGGRERRVAGVCGLPARQRGGSRTEPHRACRHRARSRSPARASGSGLGRVRACAVSTRRPAGASAPTAAARSPTTHRSTHRASRSGRPLRRAPPAAAAPSVPPRRRPRRRRAPVVPVRGSASSGMNGYAPRLNRA